MKRLLTRWVILTASVAGAALIADALNLGFVLEVQTPRQVFDLFVGSALLAFANATLGRLLKILCIPLRCLTFGLISFVINAVVLWLVASLDYGFTIKSGSLFGAFWAALVGSLLITALSATLRTVLPDDD